MSENQPHNSPVADAGVQDDRSDAHMAARARVLETAEQLFRQYGYQKTTVADIARALGMSPANVYRFYESKRAIFEAVAFNLLQVVERALAEAAAAKLPAPARLEHVLMLQHELSTQYFVGDQRIRDMVEVAINERWCAINDHAEIIRSLLERIIRDGVADGALVSADPAADASCLMTGWIRFCHPVIMNLSLDAPGPSQAQMAAFLIRSLLPPEA